jgi:hypothetical protein
MKIKQKEYAMTTYYLNQSPTSNRYYYRAVRFDDGWTVETKSGDDAKGTAITGDETKLPANVPRTVLLPLDFSGELHDELVMDMKTKTLAPKK